MQGTIELLIIGFICYVVGSFVTWAYCAKDDSDEMECPDCGGQLEEISLWEAVKIFLS